MILLNNCNYFCDVAILRIIKRVWLCSMAVSKWETDICQSFECTNPLCGKTIIIFITLSGVMKGPFITVVETTTSGSLLIWYYEQLPSVLHQSKHIWVSAIIDPHEFQRYFKANKPGFLEENFVACGRKITRIYSIMQRVDRFAWVLCVTFFTAVRHYTTDMCTLLFMAI